MWELNDKSGLNHAVLYVGIANFISFNVALYFVLQVPLFNWYVAIAIVNYRSYIA